MTKFNYHITASLARGEKIGAAALREFAMDAKGFYEQARYMTTQVEESRRTIGRLEAEIEVLKASLLSKEAAHD